MAALRVSSAHPLSDWERPVGMATHRQFHKVIKIQDRFVHIFAAGPRFEPFVEDLIVAPDENGLAGRAR